MLLKLPNGEEFTRVGDMGCRLWGEWTGGGDGSSESEDSDMDTKKHK